VTFKIALEKEVDFLLLCDFLSRVESNNRGGGGALLFMVG